ncbi:glycosyl hydrolase [Profundibacter sp.]
MKVADTENGIYLGVFTSADGLENIAQFEQNAETNSAIVHMHVDWTVQDANGDNLLTDFATERPDVGTSVSAAIESLAQDNRILAISWDPTSIEAEDPGHYNGDLAPKIDLQSILDGTHDDYIHLVAQQMAELDTPVMMNLFGEANAIALLSYGAGGTSYRGSQDDQTGQYGDPTLLDGPERVRDVFRHVIDIFQQENAHNVSWFMYMSSDLMTEPDSVHPSEFYPGDEYIDFVGQSLYVNDPSEISSSLDAGYAAWGEVTDKPFFIPEMGLTQTDQPDALATLLAQLTQYERLAAVTLSDFDAAETQYGVPRIGARAGDWAALSNATGYLSEVQISVSDTGETQQFSAWRSEMGFVEKDHIFIGTDGNDIMVGSDGADALEGGGGDDLYLVNQAGDIIIEGAAGGTDTVLTHISYALDFGTEILILEGETGIGGTGNDANNQLIGNAGNNLLIGRGGDDILNGSSGADRMEGGTGDDTYFIDNAGDVIVENAGAGTDIIYSVVNATAALNTEILALDGTENINATGNNQNDILVGNTGNNTLAGMAGDDYLIGNDGDDILIGNDGADIIEGGNGSDTLSGGGGLDVLDGGAGNDRLIIEDSGDFALGGTGADVFVFLTTQDIAMIGDFNAAEDTLDISHHAIYSQEDFIPIMYEAGGGVYLAPDGQSSLFIQNISIDDLLNSQIIYGTTLTTSCLAPDCGDYILA